MYTWDCSKLDTDNKKLEEKSSCGSFIVQPVLRKGSSRKRSQKNKLDSITFNQRYGFPSEVMLYYFLSAVRLI